MNSENACDVRELSKKRRKKRGEERNIQNSRVAIVNKFSSRYSSFCAYRGVPPSSGTRARRNIFID